MWCTKQVSATTSLRQKNTAVLNSTSHHCDACTAQRDPNECLSATTSFRQKNTAVLIPTSHHVMYVQNKRDPNECLSATTSFRQENTAVLIPTSHHVMYVQNMSAWVPQNHVVQENTAVLVRRKWHGKTSGYLMILDRSCRRDSNRVAAWRAEGLRSGSSNIISLTICQREYPETNGARSTWASGGRGTGLFRRARGGHLVW